MTKNKALLDAAINAGAMLDAVYQWVDRVERAGGCTCLAGISEAHAMIASLKKNRKRTEDLVIKPLRTAIVASQMDVANDD